VVVRAEVVRRKLHEIEEAVAHLRSWAVTQETLERDRQLRWAVERGLQVAAEALFDTGAHILAAELYHTERLFLLLAPLRSSTFSSHQG
jgi:uncharacterized protein YutE (UPF0331/DUF86 family)